jgi:hypothetical protein
MIRIIFFIVLTIITKTVSGQRVVFDRNHFNIVNENGAVRLGAENTHNSYLNTINSRLDDINLNISSVAMVQGLILHSLTQVNQALKSGLAVQQISRLSLEIIKDSNELIEMAKDQPYLLLFAEDVARQMKNRGLKVVNEVSDFILKEGDNVLMDFEKRDALLQKIVIELKVMRTLVYSLKRSMYWAKINGVWRTLNPYRSFINQDKRLVDDILYNYHLVK